MNIHDLTSLGMIDEVRVLLEKDPTLVHAKGIDGCRPLHLAKTREIADLLLQHAAEINARDDDHDSTPAQWRIGDSPDVVRFLLERGARSDIFMASALGDLEMVNRLLRDNPNVTSYRIGNNSGPFPGIGFQGRGGTIYQWTLGFNLSPHEVALYRGHQLAYELLMDHSSVRTKFLVACTTANRSLATDMISNQPDIAQTLNDEDWALLPKFCWETNKNIEAVRLMLDLGFPITTQEHSHGCTALHNAAWCGDPELVGLLLDRGHPPAIRDPQYGATPIGFALHSCLEAKRHPEGKFPEVIELLLEHGTPLEPDQVDIKHEGIRAVIRKYQGGEA